MRHRPSSLYNTDHYREDPLRDSSDFRWHSMNPALRDMAFMDGSFITQHHHILLLPLEEAQQVIDDLMGGVDRFFISGRAWQYKGWAGCLSQSDKAHHLVQPC